MTKRKPTNVAASIRQRLLNMARERGEEFQLLLTRFANERLLYRLSRSEYADRFILKGAMLYSLWSGAVYRATRDVDLLGTGDSAAGQLAGVFRDICEVGVEDDGLSFESAGIRTEEIRDAQEYGGVRVTVVAYLAKARIPIQIDIGFGDAVTPGSRKVTLPTLLDLPAPRVKAYPPESVIAEKFQAMSVLGIVNSRMKDFYDVWALAQNLVFKGPTLCKAIKATFERRRTSLPAQIPVAFSSDFSGDATKQAQWRAFINRAGLDAAPADLTKVVGFLRRFLMPPVEALQKNEPFDKEWPPGGPWKPSS